MKRIVFLFLLLVSLIYAKELFTATDMHKLIRVGTPVVSPRGDLAAYTVRRYDFVSNQAVTNIETVAVNKTNSIRKITLPPWGVSDSSPSFSPDGKTIAFLSSRNGAKSQIFVVSVEEGEESVCQLTQYNVPLSNLKWSPDGSFLVASAQVYVDCNTLACTEERDKQAAAVGGTLYSQLFVRHWDTFETPKRSHLLMFNVQSNSSTCPGISLSQPIDLMKDMMADAPVPPFGGSEQFTISPNGDQIAFTTELYTPQVAWSTGWKIFTVSTRNPATPPQCITSFTKARTQQPSYSPDGAYIAYLAMDKPGSESDKLHLNIYNRASGETKQVYVWHDISLSGITWLNNGLSLLADADHFGEHKLFLIDPANGRSMIIVKSLRNVGVVVVPRSGLVLLSRDSFNAPADIWQFLLGDGQDSLLQLTSYNRDALNSFALSDAQPFTFTGAMGETVQGWFFKPALFNPSKMYPAVNLIHGGPESNWGNSWSYRWNPQLWAAHGYAVVMINFHGSTGFGQNFTDSILGNWGSYPYEDVMLGLDVALKVNPWIDRNRVCGCGGSYGGYMVNYINGKNNGRYKCFVNHDGAFDTMYKYFESDELFFNENEFLGLPWDVPQNYEKWNPRNLVSTMNTPMLVIEGGRDYRITVSQALATFTALQRRGIESKFLYFPLENHWVISPPNSVMWYKEVLEWLDRWTK